MAKTLTKVGLCAYLVSIFFPLIGNTQESSPTIREILSYHDLHGFDKAGGTDKDVHCYVELYSELFKKLRDKEINILEIGVLLGGSALLWHDYLSRSHLYLLDIVNTVHPKVWNAMDPRRYHFELRDAYTTNTVIKMKALCFEGFDVIIDDGDHVLESQIFVIKAYLDLLKEGGMLIIEDVQKFDYFKILSEQIPPHINASVETYDFRSINNRYDDLVLVIRKN